jgi:hypothetical protein
MAARGAVAFLVDERMETNAHQQTSREGPTEWTCTYCSSAATTIRQGSPVCYQHASQLRAKVGLAGRILKKLRARY